MKQPAFIGLDKLTTALFSPCRAYRYLLYRRLGGAEKRIMFIGLNPSTADEITNDPTITRCIGFARKWGYSGLVMANLFAFRATKPKDMKLAADPIGPDNMRWLLEVAHEQMKYGWDIVAAWGAQGTFLNQDQKILRIFVDDGIHLQCLGLTKGGLPKHPLFLRQDIPLMELL